MKTDKNRLIIPDFMIALKAIKDQGESSVTDLHHYTKITYAHLHHLKQTFLDKNWIILRPEGVKHILSISNKGDEIVQGIVYLLEKMEISHKDIMEYRKRTKHKKNDKEKLEEVIETNEEVQQYGEKNEETYQ